MTTEGIKLMGTLVLIASKNGREVEMVQVGDFIWTLLRLIIV